MFRVRFEPFRNFGMKEEVVQAPTHLDAWDKVLLRFPQAKVISIKEFIPNVIYVDFHKRQKYIPQ